MENNKKIFNVITEIYIIFILIFFPLTINQDGYEKILEIKYYSYLSITIIYLLLNFIIYFYYLLFKKINYFKNFKVKKYHIFLLIFLVANIVSTLISPYKDYDLIKGIGRGEGLLNVSLYILMVLNISVFGKYNKRYLLYFVISNILVSSIGLLQFFNVDPLNLYKELSGPYNMSYISTIGNVDFMSAYYTIMLPIAFLSFVFLKKDKKINILYFISMVLGITVFLLIDVDSGKVAFLFITMLIFPYILKNNFYISKFLICLSTVIFGYFIVYFTNMTYYYSNFTYKPEFNFTWISLILIITIIFLIITANYAYKNKYEFKSIRKIQKHMYLSYILFGFIALIVLYYYPFKSGMLYQIHEMLHGNFDDTFGTYRLFLWKRSLNLIGKYPLLGTGPDTFAMRFMSKYYLDVIKLDGYITINDSAANVYLTTLVNLGIVGLISYLLMIFSVIKNNIKYMYPYKSIFLVALICFLVQDFFNLTVVIVTPIYYLLIGILTLNDN